MADGLGVFRTVRRGDVEMEVNSKDMNQDRYIDQSRLGAHEVWEPSTDPKKPGKVVMKSEDPVANARNHMGALKFRSSFKSEDCDENPRGCSYPGGW